MPNRERSSRSSTPIGRSLAATSSGCSGPPRPIATITTSRPLSRSSRAVCPATAVFPTRLPVPITATAGIEIGSRGGGLSSKSAPS